MYTKSNFIGDIDKIVHTYRSTVKLLHSSTYIYIIETRNSFSHCQIFIKPEITNDNPRIKIVNININRKLLFRARIVQFIHNNYPVYSCLEVNQETI